MRQSKPIVFHITKNKVEQPWVNVLIGTGVKKNKCKVGGKKASCESYDAICEKFKTYKILPHAVMDTFICSERTDT